MRAGTSSEPIRAKTNTRLPGAAAHNSRCFLRFVGADDIPRSQLRQGLMAVRRRPPNARSSGLRPLKWFNLAPQPSPASCHQMPLPISAVHHLPPAVPLSRSCWRVNAVARHHSTPVRSAAPSRRPSGACNRAASLGVSLWSCKNFIVKVRPRSFSGLASPTTYSISF